GSNSARVVVVHADAAGRIEVVREVRAPLRLVRAVDATGALSLEAEQRVLDTLGGFRAVANAAGADQVIVVATAAIREAQNGTAFVEHMHRELALDVHVLSGREEAQYATVGALYGLACEHGMLIDVGGGSMQIAHF